MSFLPIARSDGWGLSPIPVRNVLPPAPTLPHCYRCRARTGAIVQTHFTIRRAGPADASAVAALTIAAYARWVPLLGRKPLPMLADYDAAVVAHRIDLFERDGELAALAEFEAHPDHLLVVNLAVSPERQGQGIGATLLAHAETVARALGLAELRLYTNSLMAANVALYRRHGYAITREEQRGPGWIVIHMSKTLPAA